MDNNILTNKNGKARGLAIGTSIAVGVVMLPTVAAETTALATNDWVGISFWIATAAMLASTVFFLVERQNVGDKWKTSMTVAALVTGVAWYHYTYMREVWASSYAETGIGVSPVVYRYIDWLITVPLQIVEFYLILAAVGVATAAMFRNLFGASIVMLVAGFFGEAMSGDGQTFDGMEMIWFAVGMAAYIYILFEINRGSVLEAAMTTSESTQFAFNAMRGIVTIGWLIYPLGYFLGTGDDPDTDALNTLYNIADLVNKTAFGMMIWYAAVKDSE
tara:strand:- start:9862 stop:10686 length:825 start_codon:yes stop_codon:yes gene_type:complete